LDLPILLFSKSSIKHFKIPLIQRIRLELPLSNRHKASNQISSTYK
jgi:hypothetical protein